MKSPINPKSGNIVCVRLDKKQMKHSGNIAIIHGENNDTIKAEVIAVGKDVTEIEIGEHLFVPISSIRVTHEGNEYIICSENSVYANIIN